jgi:hypothetical protein
VANEILYVSTTDPALTAILAGEIQILLADRVYLWGHPALQYLGDLNGSGSDTVKLPQVDLYGDTASAVAEGADVPNTSLTTSNVTVAIARQAIRRNMTDLQRLTNAYGEIDVRGLALAAVESLHARFTDIVAALLGGFSSTVGTSEANLTVDNFYAAITTLELADNIGQPLFVGHGQQLADLRDALRAETGALQVAPRTQEQIMRIGPGARGMFAGVDLMMANRVPTANSGLDRAGGMFTSGAIVWADGSVPDVIGAEMAAQSGSIAVEFERDGGRALTGFIAQGYFGASEGEDARGVSVITDA